MYMYMYMHNVLVHCVNVTRSGDRPYHAPPTPQFFLLHSITIGAGSLAHTTPVQASDCVFRCRDLYSVRRKFNECFWDAIVYT